MRVKSIGLFLMIAMMSSSGLVANESKPNILFLFADDLCFEALGSVGGEVKTPNLDRLSRESTAFTRAYNMGSYSGAVCIASRTMLNTGRFLWHSQRLHSKAEKEREAGRFWSEYLKKAGYRTYMSGKWHVQAKAEKAFDVVTHVRGGMPNQTPAGYNRPIDGQPDPWSPYDPKFGGFWKGGKHWSEVLGDDAVGFVKEAAGRDEPFFMYVAFNAPHDPRQAPKKYVDMYPAEKVKLPENFLPEYPFKDAIKCSKRLRDEKLAPFPRTKRSIQVNRQEYYAIITHMDDQIGRVLDALEKSKKADNTWIFFTADHGLAVGHHGLLGKQNLFEHSTRVPFLVKGPGVAKGRKVDAPIYMQDVMPTTLALAGVSKPEHVQFKSLIPLIEGKTEKHLDAVYGGYLDVQRSVTVGSYKLLLYPAIKKILLFDIVKDPLEVTDLAERKEHTARMRSMFKRLLQLQKETGDSFDLSAAYPSLSSS